MQTTTNRHPRIRIAIFFALFAISALLFSALPLGSGDCAPTRVHAPDNRYIEIDAARGMAEQALERAREKTRISLAENRAQLTKWMDERIRNGAPSFAKTALSTRNKLRAAFASKKKYGRSLDKKMNARIFSTADLQAQCERQARIFAHDLTAIHNELAVEMNAISGRLPPETKAAFIGKYDYDMKHIQRSVLKEAGKDALVFVAAEITSSAISSVAVSTGILGTGAGAGAYTFGISIVVGIVVDSSVDGIRKPERKLAKKIIANMEPLKAEISDAHEKALADAADASFQPIAKAIAELD